VPRIALATCAAWPDLDDDGPVLLAALEDEGLDVEVHAWDATGVDWGAFDLVVIRNTWDYWDRPEAFVAWTRSVPRLANDAGVVGWNVDKTYLRRLEAAGVPVIPTTWLEPGDAFVPPSEPFVVKPSVSAGARDTAAYPASDASAAEHVARLHRRGRTVMVQPYLSAVDSQGETAVLVFDGVVSHGARKSAVLRVGEGEAPLGSWSMDPREPSTDEVALAQRVVEVVRSWGDELLYARVDVLPGPVVIELEVTEPSLFLVLAPGSAQRYAQAVRRWADRATAGASSRP
jgi:glutathione synthase/RimK-type ligase-like ATP-grasp enzyme